MIKSFVCLVAILLAGITANSQKVYSPITGSFEPDPIVSTPVIQEKLSGSIPCNPNTFWANTGAGVIQEFMLTGTQITATGNSYLIPTSITSLIFANNNSGTTGFSPTFYSMDLHILRKYDGATWVTEFVDNNFGAYNGGGKDDHIYFGGYSGPTTAPPTRVFHYNATTGIDTVYICSGNKIMNVADYAVDDFGNCYFITGSPTLASDSLVVVSPTGVVINKFPIALNMGHAYGSFMMGNVLYIGLGSSNLINPLSLIPISITPTSATIGTPISFPSSTGYIDLESCNQGAPLGIWESNNLYGKMNLYPNPVKRNSEIVLTTGSINETYKVKIITPTGQIVQENTLPPSQNTLRISTGDLTSGIYFVECIGLKQQFYSKFVIE